MLGSVGYKILLVGLFYLWLSPCINHMCNGFPSSWKAALMSDRQENHCRGREMLPGTCVNLPMKMCQSQLGLWETKTRGSLSQRCLPRRSGNLSVLVSARRDFSWRSMWLISAGLFLQQRPLFLCCKNSCDKSPWGAIRQNCPLYLPQQLSWNISAATVQGSSAGVRVRGISRCCNTLI